MLEYICEVAHAGGINVHAEDGCTTSDVQDDLVLEEVWIVADCVAVGSSAHFIFLCCGQSPKHGEKLRLDTNQHFLVDA